MYTDKSKFPKETRVWLLYFHYALWGITFFLIIYLKFNRPLTGIISGIAFSWISASAILLTKEKKLFYDDFTIEDIASIPRHPYRHYLIPMYYMIYIWEIFKRVSIFIGKALSFIIIYLILIGVIIGILVLFVHIIWAIMEGY